LAWEQGSWRGARIDFALLRTFSNPNGYWSVEQTHAIAAGDEYDRIITRAP